MLLSRSLRVCGRWTATYNLSTARQQPTGRVTVVYSQSACPSRAFPSLNSCPIHSSPPPLATQWKRRDSSIIGSTLRSFYTTIAHTTAPTTAVTDTAAATASVPKLEFPPLPSGSFMIGYLAQPGHLEEMLEEIEQQENERSHGLKATVWYIHGNLVLLRFDPTSPSTTAASHSTTDLAYLRSLFHPLHVATIWYSPRLLDFRSINDAQRQLKSNGFSIKWTSYSDPSQGLHRRTAVIGEGLPKVRKQLEEKIAFPLQIPLPTAVSPSTTPQSLKSKKSKSSSNEMVASATESTAVTSQETAPTALFAPIDRPLHCPGAFSLLSSSQLIYSPVTSSPFPNGDISFVWDRKAPPSRAYLKLYEAFTRIQVHCLQTLGLQAGTDYWNQIKPQPGALVLDLGSSPGGWTWVVQTMGATVVSVDRAELDPDIAALPGVHHIIGSGFGLEPTSEALQPFLQKKPRIDWLLSDIICYPDRSLTLIRRWMNFVEGGMIVTIKLQDPPTTADDSTQPNESTHREKGPAQLYHLSSQLDILRQLRAIPNSHLVHLCANKNEATFMWVKPPSSSSDAPSDSTASGSSD